jgi:hypothetical protein
MTDQSPEQVEPVDEPAVEPEKTTNDVTQQDDVEVDEDQTPVAQDDLGHTFEPGDEEDDAEGGTQ